MDESRVHLIIYIKGAKDMVDTLPLALIAVAPTNAILSLGIFRQVQNTVLTDLTESRTFSTVIKITCNQNLCLGIQTRDGIKRLAKAVYRCLTEGPTIAFAAITARQMHYKNMKCVARDGLAADIENITRRTHAFYRRDTKRITADGSERERAVEQGNINTSKIWR